ncbi:MAG: hypothetical protein ACUVRK_07375 [Spirochaetota bacterium]
MNTLKLFCVICILLIVSYASSANTDVTTIYFFESAVCPHCKQANDYFGKNMQRLHKIKLIKYELVNKNGVMDQNNKKNLQILVTMLEKIKKQKGNKPFIYYERVAYGYYTRNGLPYYKSADRYSKKDEPVPVPLFIINDTVYLGFDNFVIKKIEQLL